MDRSSWDLVHALGEVLLVAIAGAFCASAEPLVDTALTNLWLISFSISNRCRTHRRGKGIARESHCTPERSAAIAPIAPIFDEKRPDQRIGAEGVGGGGGI